MIQKPPLSLSSFTRGSPEWARLLPAGFAEYASRGRWKPARHLLRLNQELIGLAARRTKRLMVFMPPRHGKSTFISQYFPCWYLGTYPNDDVILASYEANFAALWGGRVRDLMMEVGPELWGLTVRSNARASDDWRLQGLGSDGLPVTGGMRTAGIGSGLTGRGGHLIIIDDPVKDDQQAASITYRNRAWEWYQSTLYSRLEAEPDGVIVLLMTRWHEDDLAGRILANTDEDWKVLSLPAIAEGEDDALGRSEGEALWPERWTEDRLRHIQANLTPYWWSSLYQQRPAPAEGGIFKRTWWKFWKPAGVELPPVTITVPNEPDHQAEVIELPYRISRRVQSWDLSFGSQGGTSSYVVGQLWGTHGADFFLLDQTRGRWDFTQQIQAIRDFSNRHPNAAAKYVENKANAQAALTTLRDEIPGLIPVEPEGDKVFRAEGVSPYVQAGNVYLPHPALYPWVRDFIEECAAFPNAAHDDQVDSMSQALIQLRGRSGYSTDEYSDVRR